MKFKKIIRIIQYIIIFILIFLIVYISYQKFILNKKNISFFNNNFFIILSGSMEPTINVKDLIVTSPKNTYEKGDIIAFYSNENITVHRIEEKINNTTNYYITKGDKNNINDTEMISQNDIVGAYKYTIPLLGSIFIYFYSNYILFFTLLIAFILIYIIIKLIKKRDK